MAVICCARHAAALLALLCCCLLRNAAHCWLAGFAADYIITPFSRACSLWNRIDRRGLIRTICDQHSTSAPFAHSAPDC